MPHLPDHATHDPELIAAYAAGDATGPALTDASELVAGCADCAALHRDLRAIAVALPALPAPVRPRDFRLTPEQAASLAPSGWRGVLAAFASPRFRLAAPLGTGLAAIGLAGLLLGTPGSVLPAGGAGSAAEAATGAAGAPTVAGDAAAGAGPAAAAPVIESSSSSSALPAPSAAASEAAALAPLAVPAPAAGVSSPPASMAASSSLPDRAYAAGAAPSDSAGRNALTANGQAPSASIPTSGEAGLAIETADQGISQPAGSPLVPVLAAVMFVLGLALIVLRLLARRLA